jgi:hypothetical protein
MTRAAVLDTREEWLEDAVATIHALAHSQGSVTADDLHREMREPPHSNLPGIAFSIATNRGYIHSIGRQRSSTKSRKGARIDIWAAVKEES